MEQTLVTSLVNAKSIDEVILISFCALIIAILFLFKHFSNIIDGKDKQFSERLTAIEESHAQKILEISKAHTEQIIQLNNDFNNRIERIMQTHREEVTGSLNKVIETITLLNRNIEKSNIKLIERSE